MNKTTLNSQKEKHSMLSLRRATFRRQRARRGPQHFYPRSPYGERPTAIRVPVRRFLFLSTLSLRRATALQPSKLQGSQYFYPRSPCGERPIGRQGTGGRGNFYPRSPCGERQHHSQVCDAAQNFYPRSPCGERLSKRRLPSSCRRFLSTLSLRRATYVFETGLHSCNDFYPRSPCGERRFCTTCWQLWTKNFYPRSPCGERLRANGKRLRTLTFLSTLSLRRATRSSCAR